MFVMPAIDIIGGKCVRLRQGKFDAVTEYSDDPLAVAKQFQAQGAQMLHIIDLEGAKAGRPLNRELILTLARTLTIPVEAGGGIRSYDTARDYLQNGVQRVLLSTAVITEPQLVKRLIKEFGADRIVVAVDIKQGRFAIEGWTKSGGKSVAQMITLLRRLGVTDVLVTDVSKDGLLGGPNFGLVRQFIEAGFRAVAAGGISTLADIEEFTKLGAFGAVAGKAVYEGTLDICQATEAAAYRNDLAKRIIPCLDVKDGRVVKGTHFKQLRDAGDPVELGQKYGRTGADELVFLDIAATLEERKTFRQLVARIAEVINIPFTVGGGISSLDDIRQLLLAGADKVSIGSAAIMQPELIREAADYFGSQCIVISADARRRSGGGWEIYIKGGTEATGEDAIAFCEQMAALGAGEILVNSLDRDGLNTGFDIDLLRAVADAVDIPVIASSGGGSPPDFLEVFKQTGVDAALGASIFHYKDETPDRLKAFLAKQGVQVRL